MPAGQEYLVDPEATALYGFSDGNPRIGLTVFEDIEDPVGVNQCYLAGLAIIKASQSKVLKLMLLMWAN